MAKIYDETIADDFSFLNNFCTAYTLKNPVADFVAPPFAVKREAGKYVEYTKTVFRIWDDKIIGEEPAKEIQYVKLLNQNLSQDSETLIDNAKGNAALNSQVTVMNAHRLTIALRGEDGEAVMA